MFGVLLALMAVPAAADAAGRQYYVSLGDSYAAGYQPGRGSTLNGFVYHVPAIAGLRGYRLQVVNFGCSGATTQSLLSQIDCPANGLGPGAAGYPGLTQLQAATKFIRAHRSRVALITVSIGGNDVTACANPASSPTCTADAMVGVRSRLRTIAGSLRSAAGSRPKLVGTTYPDVLLGAWVNPGGEVWREAARKSVVSFRTEINPGLRGAYASARGALVDVTAKTGAYGRLDRFSTLAPWGTIPKPVAEICRLGFFCQENDIHLTRAGYKVIAQMVAARLPAR